MSMAPADFPGRLPGPRKCASMLLSAFSFIVFIFLDLLETLMCLLFRCLDNFLEKQADPCYCGNRGAAADGPQQKELSETLYGRRNFFRHLKLLEFAKNRKDGRRSCGPDEVNRWSDCGCKSCVSWINDRVDKLYVVVKDPPSGSPAENVIFLHGFLSSSSFWTETVFKNLSGPTLESYRLFAPDLLGFGRSPKPRDCLYTLNDHLEMIEKSVIYPHGLNSFHLVGHSMGSLIALALAAKYHKFVKSLTLIASPYFPHSGDGASMDVLKTLAGKKLWPPTAFHSSLMSWYEHLGRCFCFLFCRNHRAWEHIFKLLTGKRDLHFTIHDLTKHTHHSAWHSMHNVICGGANFMDGYLETLKSSNVKICVVHGDLDMTAPLNCGYNIKKKVPLADLRIIPNATHSSVILARKKDFSLSLEDVWAST